MAQRFSHQFSAIVFDLGDVLFRWSAVTKTPISPKTLRALMTTEIWYDYECGSLSQDECYMRLSERFSINPQDIREAFQQAKDSLTADYDLVKFIHKLKQSNPHLRIFALSNVSLPDFEALRMKPAEWGIFERVFTSGAIRERKPNLGAYQHVISATGIDPRRSIFVDDKLENVFSAESLGFRGITFDNVANVKRTLLNILCDPVPRGNAFLRANKGALHSILGTSEEDAVVIHENFAQLLMLEATDNPALVHLVESKNEFGLWNYFHDPKFMSTEDFPYDLDTTSMAHKLLRNNPEAADQVMNQIQQYLTKDGLPFTYFDPRRPRLDAGVCACVAALFHSYNRGGEVTRMTDWLLNILRNRAFVNGTYYYISPEYFLYSIVRFLNSTSDRDIHSRFIPVLTERVTERIGMGGDALALAMRIITTNFVGIRNEVDMQKLLTLQCEDGGWEMSWVYRLPSKKIKVGNRGLATAVAIKAIQSFPSNKTQVKFAPVLIKQLPQFRVHTIAVLLVALTFALTLTISRYYFV